MMAALNSGPGPHEQRRKARGLAAATLLVLCAAVLPGCRTSSDDLRRWAGREQGPSKLVAVMAHDKYPLELRVEAALVLVTMKPRRGQQIGLELMTGALKGMPKPERTRVVSALVPKLTAEIVKAAPEATDQPDGTLAFKDAAFALLTHEGESLISRAGERAQLDAALTRWAVTSFSRRLDDSSQKYGLVQVVRHLGAPGAGALPGLIAPGMSKVDQVSALVSELGDEATKRVAAERLVQLARGLSQTQELLSVFGAMKKLGQSPVKSYLLAFASDPSKPEEQRAAALAALEGHVEPRRGPQLSGLLALARDAKTPPMVRDLALRRTADLPRSVVAEDLYGLFASDDWKTRWLSGELLLRMSDASKLAEFMDHLEPVRDLAMTEAVRYGTLMGELKGPPEVSALIGKYIGRTHPAAVRVTALGYYQSHGKHSDLPALQKLTLDSMTLPRCKPDAKDCHWQCSTEADDPGSLRTVGDFVRFCVLPVVAGRTGQSPEPARQAEN